MTAQDAADTKGFLEELTQLSIKYQLVIGGCGCCGSPSVYRTSSPVDDNDFYKLSANEDSAGGDHLCLETKDDD